MRSRRGFFVIWKCLPEIAPQGHFLALRAQGATAPLGPPRNDKSESFTPQNAYRKSCQSAWRSASALYRGIKPQEGTGAPRAPLTCHCEEQSDVAISQYPAASWESYRRKRSCLPEIATSAFGLLAMTNRGAFAILTAVCTGCKCIAGRGMPLPYSARPEVCVFFILHFSVFSIHFLHMPLPYSALQEAMGKTPLSTLNSRRPAGGYPRTGISSNPGRAPIPRRGSDCSRPDCAPRSPRVSARRPAAGSARPTERNTSRFP